MDTGDGDNRTRVLCAAIFSVPSQALHESLVCDVTDLDHVLSIRQMPSKARSSGQAKARRVLDPFPVVQLNLEQPSSTGFSESVKLFPYQLPVYAMCVELFHEEHNEQVVTDLHKRPILDGARLLSVTPVHACNYAQTRNYDYYFAFPDLAVRTTGRFRLCFTLFRLQGSSFVICGLPVISDVFRVVSSDQYSGVEDATTLSCRLGQFGVRAPRTSAGKQKHYHTPILQSARPVRTSRESTRRRRSPIGNKIPVQRPIDATLESELYMPRPIYMIAHNRPTLLSNTEDGEDWDLDGWHPAGAPFTTDNLFQSSDYSLPSLGPSYVYIDGDAELADADFSYGRYSAKSESSSIASSYSDASSIYYWISDNTPVGCQYTP